MVHSQNNNKWWRRKEKKQPLRTTWDFHSFAFALRLNIKTLTNTLIVWTYTINFSISHFIHSLTLFTTFILSFFCPFNSVSSKLSNDFQLCTRATWMVLHKFCWVCVCVFAAIWTFTLHSESQPEYAFTRSIHFYFALSFNNYIQNYKYYIH